MVRNRQFLTRDPRKASENADFNSRELKT
jgi:hypothetical protein